MEKVQMGYSEASPCFIARETEKWPSAPAGRAGTEFARPLGKKPAVVFGLQTHTPPLGVRSAGTTRPCSEICAR